MLRPTHRAVILATSLCFSAPLWAQQTVPVADGDRDGRPLSLSLPRDVAAPAAVASQDAPRRNDAFNAPYGTGFEARQLGQGGRSFAGHGGSADSGFGGGGGFGGGRGGGRGR